MCQDRQHQFDVQREENRKKYMLGENALQFSQYMIYDIIYTYHNDLLKASKHAQIEVALQRKNIIPFLLRKAFVKAIYTDSKIGKIYYLEVKVLTWEKYGNFITLGKIFYIYFSIPFQVDTFPIKRLYCYSFGIKLITGSSKERKVRIYFQDVVQKFSSGARETNNSQIEAKIINDREDRT